MSVLEVSFAAEDGAEDEAELVERARRAGIYTRREPQRLTSECRECSTGCICRRGGR